MTGACSFCDDLVARNPDVVFVVAPSQQTLICEPCVDAIRRQIDQRSIGCPPS